MATRTARRPCGPPTPILDLDGDGALDAVGLDFDGDGLLDDALADLDGDGLADHAVAGSRQRRHAEAYFTDDGTGTWAVSRRPGAGQLRWFGLDGVEHTGGPLVDFDGDGQSRRPAARHRRQRAGRPRAVPATSAYVDTDGDGRWDVKLADSDGDGKADAATELS